MKSISLFDSNDASTYESAPHALASRVQFSYSMFNLSHRKDPKGRGSWIFCPVSKSNSNDYLDHCVQVRGSQLFSAAKKAAANYFAASGIDYVAVMP